MGDYEQRSKYLRSKLIRISGINVDNNLLDIYDEIQGHCDMLPNGWNYVPIQSDLVLNADKVGSWLRCFSRQSVLPVDGTKT